MSTTPIAPVAPVMTTVSAAQPQTFSTFSFAPKATTEAAHCFSVNVYNDTKNGRYTAVAFLPGVCGSEVKTSLLQVDKDNYNLKIIVFPLGRGFALGQASLGFPVSEEWRREPMSRTIGIRMRRKADQPIDRHV